MSEHPEVKNLIEQKELSLTNASLIHTFISKNKLDGKKVIERIKRKSTRDAQTELDLIAKECNIEMEREKSTTRNYGDQTLVKVYLDRDKLALAKSRAKIQDTQEFLQTLIDEKIKNTEPALEIKPRRHKASSKPRSISPAKRAFVFKDASGRCENCQSVFNLEIDHIKPVVAGGSNQLHNLRLLCRACNQRSAIKILGSAVMGPYLRIH